jgi:hypothetical protein
MSLNKISILPDLAILKMFFRYEEGKLIRNTIDESLLESTGFTIRGLRRWNSSMANLEAGHEFTTTSGEKSKQVRVNYKMYFVHRVIYKMCTGEEPILIDHINGNPLDNRIENLRSVTNMENMRNAKKYKTNTSGHVGVSWSKSCNKWEAYIWDNKIKIKLGYFCDIEDAVNVRQSAEKELEYHKNHGR